MEQLLKWLLDWATAIKNQNKVEGNSSTIVGGGLERLIGAISDLQKNKADVKALAEVNLVLNTTKQELENKIEDATTNNKGIFSTLTELQSLFPKKQNKKDWFAFIGVSNPREKYIVKADGEYWVTTGEMHNILEADLEKYAKVNNPQGDKVVYGKGNTIRIEDYEGDGVELTSVISPYVRIGKGLNSENGAISNREKGTIIWMFPVKKTQNIEYFVMTTQTIQYSFILLVLKQPL